MENNIFTPSIVDVILPGCTIERNSGKLSNTSTNMTKSTRDSVNLDVDEYG